MIRRLRFWTRFYFGWWFKCRDAHFTSTVYGTWLMHLCRRQRWHRGEHRKNGVTW